MLDKILAPKLFPKVVLNPYDDDHYYKLGAWLKHPVLAELDQDNILHPSDEMLLDSCDAEDLDAVTNFIQSWERRAAHMVLDCDSTKAEELFKELLAEQNEEEE